MPHEPLDDFAANAWAPEKPEARGPQQLQLAVRGNDQPLATHHSVAQSDSVDRRTVDLGNDKADAPDSCFPLVNLVARKFTVGITRHVTVLMEVQYF